MENQYMLTKVPSNTEIFVFGSILRVSNPNDFDIIIVYDSLVYPLATIYDSSKEIINCLEEEFKIKIHVTYLSYKEINQTTFLREVSAIPLMQFLKLYRVPNSKE